MPARRASPALSEAEVDIGASLFGQAEDDNSTNEIPNKTIDTKLDYATGANALELLGEDSDLDDAVIIAQQQAASNRKSTNLKGRTVKKGGGFQSMGLNANLLKAITRKGFSVPTPIQRKTIPLVLNEKDVVGMARTGSGKTAAFLIPMIEKLKIHSTQVGARGLILSPSRELALQTLQVCRELAKGTDLKTILLVGGDSLEDQFAAMASNPDIIVATPGRFVHLKVEMGLDLSSIRYAVFDEADRLFEMGFEAQLTEVLHSLPPSRQTLLFSATLPKSLVEFARAGLQDPVLVRLDTESKVSPDLQSAFFTVRSAEKEGALLHILQDVIHIPSTSQLELSSNTENEVSNGKKRKRGQSSIQEKSEILNPHSTIVFAATKHHVEYLSRLLTKAGYAVSHVYGSLDQTARKMQVHAFRTGRTNILVVTDVAARGIDIPVLANVINYDFPSQPKIFVHRVGRTARAGQKGWSYSIIHDADAPYLLDLQLFLSRKLLVGREQPDVANYAEDVVVGSLQRDNMQTSCEWVSRTLEDDVDIAALRAVAVKGEKLYQRTRNSASSESAKRAKGVVASAQWSELHPLFSNEANDLEVQREKMLARIGGFRPEESIFEIGARRGGRKNNEEAVDAMRRIRSGLEVKKQKSHRKINGTETSLNQENDKQANGLEQDDEITQARSDALGMSEASESEIEVTFTNQKRSKRNKIKESRGQFDADDSKQAFRDTENFMSYTPATLNLSEDRAYGVHSGSNINNSHQGANFTQAARNATMDLAGDETGGKAFGEARQAMRWDKRHKKYVRRTNDEDGSKGGNRLVRSESGAKIAASFRSGRYDAWRRANRISQMPRVGQTENPAPSQGQAPALSGKHFKHKKVQTAKAPDKFRDDFEKKSKKLREAKEKAREMGELGGGNSNTAAGRQGKRSNKAGGKITNTVDDIRKQRRLNEKRKEKNGRPSRRPQR